MKQQETTTATLSDLTPSNYLKYQQNAEIVYHNQSLIANVEAKL